MLKYISAESLDLIFFGGCKVFFNPNSANFYLKLTAEFCAFVELVEGNFAKIWAMETDTVPAKEVH